MSNDIRIKKIRKILRANPNIEFAYLFGSQAKGFAGERSDWDIAVYFKNDAKKLPQWTVFYLEAEISKEIGSEVQITALNDVDSPLFLFQIISDGVVLIDSNSNKRILFEAETLKHYHDWQYFLSRQMTHR